MARCCRVYTREMGTDSELVMAEKPLEYEMFPLSPRHTERDNVVLSLLLSGDFQIVKTLGEQLNCASNINRTPLHIASLNEDLKCVLNSLDQNADVNAADQFGVTPLHLAAYRGNFMCLKALLDAGANCSLVMTPLNLRLRCKFSNDCASYVGGATPLHLAAAKNHVNCVEELIRRGADCKALDEFARTSLYIAVREGFTECVLAHLNVGAARDFLCLPCTEELDTPLHCAVEHERVDCVRELLRFGADVNLRNNSGLSALHLAVSSHGTEGPNMEILKLLVLEGFNTDINLPDDEYGVPETALHYVCIGDEKGRQTEMAKFLIAYGADVNIEVEEGYDLLHYELASDYEDRTLLMSVMKSLLQLPHIEYLTGYSDIHDIPPEFYNSEHFEWDSSTLKNILEKQLWYEKLASNPRTLKHSCRYVIRKILRPSRLKYVRKLLIPKELQEYLLLESFEI